MGIDVRYVGYDETARFVSQHHYANSMPSITKVCVGLYDAEKLLGVSSWGYGTRPLHTIKKIFPEVEVKEYMELGRLCVHDDQPRNTESAFMSDVCAILKRDMADLSLLFSWADGMRGKPGYVYQASGWLYGGYIWTDTYLTERGEIVHPRLYQTKIQTGRKDGMKCGQRPTPKQLEEMGWKHYFGKQFRYCKFLGSRGEQKRLLRNSPFQWSQNYPKQADLEWKIYAGEGSRVNCEQPMFAGSVRFRNPAPLFESNSF